MEAALTLNTLDVLDEDAQRLTREMLNAVVNFSHIHVDRFTIHRRSRGENFVYFLGLQVANAPTPFKNNQMLSHNMVSQLQYIGFVVPSRHPQAPNGWYDFTEKALEWFRLYGEQENRRPRIDGQASSTESQGDTKPYDVFISHAWEDKAEFVRPLATALRNVAVRVWYDEFALKIGDSLRQSIDRGLANSRYGVVVLSPQFFYKGWTNYELNGLITKAMNANGKPLILPIWHNLTKLQLMEYSPSIADILAMNTRSRSADEIAAEIALIVKEGI